MTTKNSTELPLPIHPQTKIGHIHLTVADLERSLAFYRDLLGFEVTMRYGDGVELSTDRPPEAWPREAQGKLKMGGRRALDLNDLLAELEHEVR